MNILRDELSWLLSLSKRLVKVLPGITACSVILTLLSHMALLVSFVLPLKVILLLGSDTIPRYFPSFLREYERQTLILVLSGLSVVLYLVHVGAERLVAMCISVGSHKILQRSRKIILFENQDDIASKAYQRFSRGAASLVFLLVFVPVLAFLNIKLASVFVAFILLVVVASLLFPVVVHGGSEHWLYSEKKMISFFTGLGFLLCFAYMVAEFLWLSPSSVLIAVICLILLRQLFRHIESAFNDLKVLIEQRRSLSALFFHGQHLMEPPQQAFDGVWSLIEIAERDAWLGMVLRDVTNRSLEIKAVRWLQLGVADVLAYRVVAGDQEGDRCFLVKVFNSNRNAMAKHEATLLTKQTDLPSLELLGVTDVNEQFHCLVFNLGSARQALGKKWPVRCEVARSVLLACEPNKDLRATFLRSKSSLHQRMDRNALHRMQCLLGNSAQLASLKAFDDNFDAIKQEISKLPLAFTNPDIRRGLVMLNDEAQVQVCHWARWALEPVGSGWPVDEKAIEAMKLAYAAAKKKRSDFSNTEWLHLMLVALIYVFDARCRQQDYIAAAELLESINATFSAIYKLDGTVEHS